MTESDRIATLFCERWDDAARHFLSAMWHDPDAGQHAGYLYGLSANSFPDLSLWYISQYLCIAAELHATANIQTLVGAAKIDHQPLDDGNIENLRWLEYLEYGPHNAEYCARRLAGFRDRADLFRALRDGAFGLLGPLADVQHTPKRRTDDGPA